MTITIWCHWRWWWRSCCCKWWRRWQYWTGCHWERCWHVLQRSTLPISQPASQRATHKAFNSLHISHARYLTFNSLHILYKKYQTFNNSQQTTRGGDAFDQKLHHLPSTERGQSTILRQQKTFGLFTISHWCWQDIVVARCAACCRWPRVKHVTAPAKKRPKFVIDSAVNCSFTSFHQDTAIMQSFCKAKHDKKI